jgi:hypothetical protein
VNVSPLPVPKDLKKPTLGERHNEKRSKAIASSAKGMELGLIVQK